MRQLVFSPKALWDIDTIYDYTEAHFGLRQAETYTSALVASCRALPSGRQRTRQFRHVDPQFQLHRYRSHFIFHRINEAGEIEIVRILHYQMQHEEHL